MSPNSCLVLISPVPFTTVTASSFNSHEGFAPARLLHFDKSFPSNKIIASEGASPEFFPGVTTGAFISHTSVTLGSSDSRGGTDDDGFDVITITPYLAGSPYLSVASFPLKTSIRSKLLALTDLISLILF